MQRVPLFLFSMLLHAWVGWRIAPALTAFAPADWLLWGALSASALLMPMGLVGRRLTRGPVTTALVWAGLACMGWFSTLAVLTLLRDGLLVMSWAGAALAGLAGWGGRPLDALPTWSALAVLSLSLVATMWGFWHARRTAQVVRVDVPITGLPAALHGFTVAQISDIHVGPTIRQGYLQRIVNRVNALGVDMIAITGDLVDGGVPELQRHVAPVAGLRSRHGTFFVTGNHEYYSGAQAWIDELRRLGVTVLMNQHVVLRHADAHTGATMVVAGVADYSAHHFEESHRSDPAAAIAGAPENAGLRLLLAHQPRSAPAAANAGFDLQLSGHTHGGQFWPWMHLVKFQQPFTAGLNKLQALWVYTNRGTGYWGPPKRFGVPSEITHLRLVAA